jgi:hypothetical protein
MGERVGVIIVMGYCMSWMDGCLKPDGRTGGVVDWRGEGAGMAHG